MFGVCLRYAPDKSMAEDFMQEGFIRIFMKLDSFKSHGSLEGWMRRIIVNTALESLRKKDILRNSLELSDADQQHAEFNNAVVLSTEDEESDDQNKYQVPPDVLYKLINEMPVGFRTVFNLYAVEDYSHKEIGSMLNISEGTSKSQYARARAWLQKRLNESK